MAQTKRDTLILQVGAYAKGQLPFHVKQLRATDPQRRNGTGRFNGCRRKRVKRNTSNKLYIGTWNVKTLLKPSKMQELAEELAKTQLEIVAVQETRWSGTGLIKKKDYNRTKDQIGQDGIGFILLGGIINNVIGFEAMKPLTKRPRGRPK